MAIDLWWAGLCAVASFNIAMWIWSARVILRRRSTMRPKVYFMRRAQLLLSGVYVFGCAFRSYFPVYDIPRLTLSQHWIANALVGRSVATVAELCFAAQWSLLMREVQERTGTRSAGVAARCVLPLIVVAEICSWYSVLTTANIGHVIEETLWGICAVMVLVGLVTSAPWIASRLRRVCYAVAITIGAYGVYLFLVDVPMYWTRWLVQEANQHHYLSISQGIIDAAQRRIVSRNWHDWHAEIVWMSVYFSLAVWISIALAHLPAPTQAFVKRRRMPSST